MGYLDPLEHMEGLAKKTDEYMGTRTRSTFGRYPLLFSLMTVFGIVCVIYGFESLLAHIPFLADRPLLILFIGIFLLIFTGSLYKSLDRPKLD